MHKIGQGYDAHCFAEGRKLILGGVEIPYPKGLMGHSDADVLSHAVAHAVLGALNLGDLGENFPDTDPSLKDICSLDILKKIAKKLEGCGAIINNIDTTVIAQSPKLSQYKKQMAANIANAFGISETLVSVKATTTEKMGFEGRSEGISAHAVCLIETL